MSGCRLIYRSVSSEPYMSKGALQELVQQSARNNSKENITGLLVVSGDRFLQVLEGPSEAVNRLFGRIMADKRHRDVNLVSFEPIGPFYFDKWSMHLVDLYNLAMQPRQFLTQKYDHKEGVIRIPEKLHEAYSLLLDAKVYWHAEPQNG